MVGTSPAMQRVYRAIEKIARSSFTTVLIRGESGTGKELVARSIHAASAERHQPFVEVNCTAIPEALLEAELFGHERGAFTDAVTQKRGLFELADGGTLLLDEIGHVSPGLQAKLLGVLETMRFRRLGGTEEICVRLRIITATNRNLETALGDGSFREDLYYRLNVISLDIHPLRERGNDVLLLADHFRERYSEAFEKEVTSISPEARSALLSHRWPGNVRELKNVIERAVLLESDEVILPAHLGLDRRREPQGLKVSVGDGLDIVVKIPPGGISLEEVEKRLIEETLKSTGGNQSETARFLRISRYTLRYRMRRFGLL